MTKITEWWQSIPPTWRVMGVLSTVFWLGITTGILAGAMFGLPERVEALERKSDILKAEIAENRREVENLKIGQERIICILEVQLMDLDRICR